VLFALAMMFYSGLAIWKPVQFKFLAGALGGFQDARLVHFLFMAAIVLFLLVPVTLVALVPKTLLAMVTGRATALPPTASHHAYRSGHHERPR
jgi:thiosulfate reductase cytochrome b subunit